MLKFERIANLLESRVESGVYALRELPGEERLAEEMGVSRRTSRRALLALEQKGLLKRLANGRLKPVTLVEESADPVVCVLYPAWRDIAGSLMFTALHHAARAAKVSLWPRQYTGWEDPEVTRLLSRSVGDRPDLRGVVLFAPAETMSPLIRRQIADFGAHLLMVGRDLTADGVVSLMGAPAGATRRVAEHLLQESGGPVDCFNTQPLDEIITGRLASFRQLTEEAGRLGGIVNDPVSNYGDPIAHARTVGRRYLSELGPDQDRAILCLTEAAAVGLLRAAHDLRLEVGDRLKIAAVNDTGLCQNLFPSVTSVRPRDTTQDFEACLCWMRDRTAWSDPHLLAGDHIDLFIGESTAGP
ncbi:MAG: substrate-binding domain-containing protein [Planctomycetota bacterium]